MSRQKASRRSRVAGAVLPRADAAQRDGIDKFQMARVKAKRDVNFAPVRRRPIAAVSEVIFHVAASLPEFRLGVGEFAENLARIFSGDVRQHVEPAAMRHADDDVAHALAPDFSIARSSSGRSVSQPSSEKVFAPRNFLRRNSSKITASVSRVRIRNCSSRESCKWFCEISIRLLQPFAHRQVVNVHETATPMEPQ